MTETLKRAVKRARETAVIAALRRSSGNVAAAAKSLGAAKSWVHILIATTPSIKSALNAIRLRAAAAVRNGRGTK